MLRFFSTPQKIALWALPTPSWWIFNQKSKIWAPKAGLKNYGIAGVVASGALLKTLLDLLVPYGFVLGPFWGRCWSLLEAFWVPFGSLGPLFGRPGSQIGDAKGALWQHCRHTFSKCAFGATLVQFRHLGRRGLLLSSSPSLHTSLSGAWLLC